LRSPKSNLNVKTEEIKYLSADNQYGTNIQYHIQKSLTKMLFFGQILMCDHHIIEKFGGK